MSLTIKSTGDFEKLDKGRYAAICYKIVDMGTTNTEYEGKVSPKKQVRITFETTSEMMADGRPFSINQTYTASLSTMANLRKHLESWRNKNFTEEEEAGFDITNLLGCTADVEVGHTSGGNEKIIGLRYPEGGVQKVATKNEQIMKPKPCAMYLLIFQSGYKKTLKTALNTKQQWMKATLRV